MGLLDYIIPEWFFGAFFIGILIAFVHKPDPTVIVKHPTPYNVDEVTYKDKAENCYAYKATSVECPKDAKMVQNYVFKD